MISNQEAVECFEPKFDRLLVVSLYVNGVGYPIAWRLLPKRTKRDDSDTSRRIAIIKKVLKAIKPTQIKCLLMDKEFIGEDWLKWLNQQQISYIARIKDNALVNETLPVKSYRKGRSRKKMMRTQVIIYGQYVYLSYKPITSKNRRSEYLFTVSNPMQGEEMLELYTDRWSIEQMFSHWKSRVFDFECTHITNCKRLMGLIGLIALSYTMVYPRGTQLNSKLAIKREKHGYLAKSIFRYGLDHFKHAMRILEPAQTVISHIIRLIFGDSSFVR